MIVSVEKWVGDYGFSPESWAAWHAMWPRGMEARPCSNGLWVVVMDRPVDGETIVLGGFPSQQEAGDAVAKFYLFEGKPPAV